MAVPPRTWELAAAAVGTGGAVGLLSTRLKSLDAGRIPALLLIVSGGVLVYAQARGDARQKPLLSSAAAGSLLGLAGSGTLLTGLQFLLIDVLRGMVLQAFRSFLRNVLKINLPTARP